MHPQAPYCRAPSARLLLLLLFAALATVWSMEQYQEPYRPGTVTANVWTNVTHPAFVYPGASHN
jgi:hypothetical protein